MLCDGAKGRFTDHGRLVARPALYRELEDFAADQPSRRNGSGADIDQHLRAACDPGPHQNLLAVGATAIGLLLTIRRDTRADNQALRAEVRSDLADLQTDV